MGRKITGPLPPYLTLCSHYQQSGQAELQRLGQWFYNTYDASGHPFPELFYTTSIRDALRLIYTEYYA